MKKKLKSKKRNNKQKGRTILIWDVNKVIRYKRVRLFRRYCKKSYTVKEWVQNVFNNYNFLDKLNRKIIFCLKYFSKVKLNEVLNYESNESVRRKTIKKSLIRGNVEINPGPHIEVVTFNCNGLGNRQKRDRLLLKSNKIAGKGGIVMLQETHIVKETVVSSKVNSKFWISSGTTNSAGVLTIVGSNFKEIEIFRDDSGRQLFIVVESNTEKFLVANVYCPNDHRRSKEFVDEVYNKILQIRNKYPDVHTILAGDFNSCINNDDFINRNKTSVETDLTDTIKQHNLNCDLIDTYREKNKELGYTWNRGNCYSRLDYIYASIILKNRIVSSEVDWAFDKSDHAAVCTKLMDYKEIRKGPGITKVNTNVLRNKLKTESIREEIKFLVGQIPTDWNGHKKLDFLKVILRSTIAKHTSIERKDNEMELETLTNSLNDIEILNQKVLKRLDRNNLISLEKLSTIETARLKIRSKLENIRSKIANEIDFKATANWYGEKSNKFFLNLNKYRSRQKLIDKIKDGENTYEGQVNIEKGIREFYKNLYKKDESQNYDDPNFYDLCPKLMTKDKDRMDEKITLSEMFNALKNCKDSAPGSDGIPYSVYKTFWNQIGHIIKESWDYSLEIGSIPDSHKESVITILPKEGKDLSDIKNWRPITLTNCDAKIITKVLAMRLNPILETIIDPSQTAYVPGRSVMDNLRSNKFL